MRPTATPAPDGWSPSRTGQPTATQNPAYRPARPPLGLLTFTVVTYRQHKGMFDALKACRTVSFGEALW
jgi:hypothetical protein